MVSYLKNIISYLQGTIRYKLYYSQNGVFSLLVRKHIREQYEYRLTIMDKECYNSGQCKICGCNTTALQFANKACDKPCYSKMCSSGKWKIKKALMSLTNEKL